MLPKPPSDSEGVRVFGYRALWHTPKAPCPRLWNRAQDHKLIKRALRRKEHLDVPDLTTGYLKNVRLERRCHYAGGLDRSDRPQDFAVNNNLPIGVIVTV